MMERRENIEHRVKRLDLLKRKRGEPAANKIEEAQDLPRVEGVVLGIIREKGKAKRADLLPHVGISKSSLVRLLDGMENKGLIAQVGDKKAAYYTLKGHGP